MLVAYILVTTMVTQQKQVTAVTLGYTVNVKKKHLALGLVHRGTVFEKVIVSSNIFFSFLTYLAFVWDVLKLIHRKAKGYSNTLPCNKSEGRCKNHRNSCPDLEFCQGPLAVI